jgi:enoyl-CoA hydratase/carnithine racemase
MSQPSSPALSHADHEFVTATVQELMPQVGLAYLAGDDGIVWVVTRSTPGVDLAALRPGLALQLQITRHGGHALVSRCVGVVTGDRTQAA